MKANELRIGNLVLGASRGDILTVSGNLIEQIERGIVVVGPITITEEWLVRFGFEKTHENPFLDYEWQYGWFTMSDDLKPYLGRYTDDTPFEYVHQLQNLYFALTGQELELK